MVIDFSCLMFLFLSKLNTKCCSEENEGKYNEACIAMSAKHQNALQI